MNRDEKRLVCCVIVTSANYIFSCIAHVFCPVHFILFARSWSDVRSGTVRSSFAARNCMRSDISEEKQWEVSWRRRCCANRLGIAGSFQGINVLHSGDILGKYKTEQNHILREICLDIWVS